jgi:hypothetical protein
VHDESSSAGARLRSAARPRASTSALDAVVAVLPPFALSTITTPPVPREMDFPSELRQAIKDCRERGLLVASKWCARLSSSFRSCQAQPDALPRPSTLRTSQGSRMPRRHPCRGSHTAADRPRWSPAWRVWAVVFVGGRRARLAAAVPDLDAVAPGGAGRRRSEPSPCEPSPVTRLPQGPAVAVDALAVRVRAPVAGARAP